MTVSPFITAKQIHSAIVASILEDWPTAKTSGFMRALKELPDADYMQDMAKHDKEWFDSIRMVPDVWMIDPAKRHVVMWEAVHRHDVPANKFAKMADLSWALDEDYYTLVLVRCDRYTRRAYNVQFASYVSELELMRAGEPSQGWHVPDWQKYDAAYCDAVMKAEAA